eukprot:g63007.t1
MNGRNGEMSWLQNRDFRSILRLRALANILSFLRIKGVTPFILIKGNAWIILAALGMSNRSPASLDSDSQKTKRRRVDPPNSIEFVDSDPSSSSSPPPPPPSSSSSSSSSYSASSSLLSPFSSSSSCSFSASSSSSTSSSSSSACIQTAGRRHNARVLSRLPPELWSLVLGWADGGPLWFCRTWRRVCRTTNESKMSSWLQGPIQLDLRKLSGQVPTAWWQEWAKVQQLSLKWRDEDDVAPLANLLALNSLQISSPYGEGDGLRHLRGLPALERLTLDPWDASQKTIRAGLEQIVKLSGLKYLKLRHTQMHTLCQIDWFLDALSAQASELQHLDLEWQEIKDDSLQHLRGLRCLTELKLLSDGITNQGLRHLGGLQSLTHLTLDSENVDSEGLIHLAELGGLRLLAFTSRAARFSTAGLAQLSRFQNLEHVDMRGFDDEAMAHLIGLQHLVTLGLGNCSAVSEVGLAHLCHLRGLQYLTWSNLKFTNSVLAHLSRAQVVQKLEKLSLWGSDISDDGLVHLAQWSNLRDLDLSQCHAIGDPGLAHLAGLHMLEKLQLGKCKVRGPGLASLPHTLRSLDLSSCGDVKLAYLSGFKALEKLSLSECDIFDDDLAHLVHLSNLRNLDLTDCIAIGDAGLAHLAGLPSLEVLQLESCEEIRGPGLATLPLTLRSLSLNGCRAINGIALAGLQRLRVLEHLYLSPCVQVSDEILRHLPCKSIHGGKLETYGKYVIVQTCCRKHTFRESCHGYGPPSVREPGRPQNQTWYDGDYDSD